MTLGRLSQGRDGVDDIVKQSLSVVLLVRSLNYGGAERRLVELAKGLRARGHAVVVVVFYREGPLLADLYEAGVSVTVLDKRHRWDVVAFLWRLLRLLRRLRPDVVYAFLVEPSILALLLKPFLRRVRIVWGVAACNMDYRLYGWFPRVTFHVSRLLARYADLIIANSWSGKEYHVQRGYPARRTVVVPNGFDLQRFRPDAAAGRRIRAEWGLGDDQTVIGIIGRLDPIKDYVTSLEAAAIIRQALPDVRLLSVGDGATAYAIDLRAKAESLKIADIVVWAGPQHDMRSVYNALDVLCSSSVSEGLPNVLGEAMACGVPCVATDVGDCARVLGEWGLVVPPKDPVGLAKGLLQMINRRGPALRHGCRDHVEREFSLDLMVQTTERLLRAQVNGDT